MINKAQFYWTHINIDRKSVGIHQFVEFILQRNQIFCDQEMLLRDLGKADFSESELLNRLEFTASDLRRGF